LKITIVDYDPDWPARFEAEATRLREALGSVAVRIDHVGSSAVPGLPAKPIVDIQVSVRQLEPMIAYRLPLEGLGYEYEADPNMEDYRFFRGSARPRLVHIHVCEAGSFHERRHLAFRDWMRTHPGDAQRYAALKQRLAAREWASADAYADAKGPFIDEIVRRAVIG
jgi:GrpB-like predicted nucleotidyltransferase (UPF0157 family)